MKKLLLILLCLPLLFGCGTNNSNDINRVLIDELINKGDKDIPIMYFESELFNGIAFDIFPNGQLESEGKFKEGKREGCLKIWDENGELFFEGNYKSGLRDGAIKMWNEKGVLIFHNLYKNDIMIEDKLID